MLTLWIGQWRREGHQRPRGRDRPGEEAAWSLHGGPEGQYREGHRFHQEPTTKVNAPIPTSYPPWLSWPVGDEPCVSRTVSPPERNPFSDLPI